MLLGVTLLTSLGKEDLPEICLTGEPSDIVVARARLSALSGLHGIVCSPDEVKSVREAAGSDLAIITPGIRPYGKGKKDQKRAATPADAIKNGADYLVVGRPIRDAQNPKKAAEDILNEIADALVKK
jgi:orotidine-5'-phosphate decarboxylase